MIANKPHQSSGEALKTSKFSFSPNWRRDVLALLMALVALIAWDATGLDLALAHLHGNATGFALRDAPLLANWLHDKARTAGWLVLLALTVTVVRPAGILTRLSRRDRTWMLGAMWLSPIAISVLKSFSHTSCPWDLAEFGGSAQYVSHWLWGVSDGGGGRCFPAGHASTGFAFLALAVWLRTVSRPAAWLALVVVLIVGFGLGWVQQVRGAHYLSHTLWTGWLCWATALAVFWLSTYIHQRAQRR